MQSKSELSNPSQPVRTRLVTSAIPQHYIVRPNRLETVFLAAASIVTGILLVAYLMAARGMDGDATQLYRILLGVLFLACFAYTLKNVWSWLEVDGEQLRYHVWRAADAELYLLRPALRPDQAQHPALPGPQPLHAVPAAGKYGKRRDPAGRAAQPEPSPSVNRSPPTLRS